MMITKEERLLLALLAQAPREVKDEVEQLLAKHADDAHPTNLDRSVRSQEIPPHRV